MPEPVTREQFDAHLEEMRAAREVEGAAQADYIAAVDAFITNPAVIDLAAEDATVGALLEAVNTEKADLDAAKSRIPLPPQAGARSKK